jgi:hypothetical protein
LTSVDAGTFAAVLWRCDALVCIACNGGRICLFRRQSVQDFLQLINQFHGLLLYFSRAVLFCFFIAADVLKWLVNREHT